MRERSSEKSRIRRLRAKYRKRVWIVGIIMLVIGLILGVLAGRAFFSAPKVDIPSLTSPSMTPESTDATSTDIIEPSTSPGEDGEDDGFAIGLPEASPTPEPTATATPVPETTLKATVPFGESYTFTTQIKNDGSARIGDGTEAYETISFTMSMQGYMRPEDFANKYASQYKLRGTEAGAGFELILNDYTGTATIVPQNVVKIGFESESGNTTDLGYQLMDAEMAGNVGIVVSTNTPKMLYKRHVYSNDGEEMKYLAVSCYNNGAIEKILFELESDVVTTPTPASTYAPLQKGDKSDAVIELQERLIEMGYLTGDADGDYGGKTVDAVKAAQKAFEMTETGTADNELQQKLFAGVH